MAYPFRRMTSHPAGLRPTHVLLFHKHRSQPVCPSCAGIPADEAEGAPCAEAKRGKHRATGGGGVEEDHCRSATTVELHLAQIWVRTQVRVCVGLKGTCQLSGSCRQSRPQHRTPQLAPLSGRGRRATSSHVHRAPEYLHCHCPSTKKGKVHGPA